ncbi:Saccharopine dehydrogenase-domain-containing protein [Chytriomyces cf. hyalinus JEL632]|nr:Saccharopine dehydrogenase-domain-containing protein [Chytriomyces cf. hyalinus JEL632]
MGTRPYDIVLYGATGFTGQFVATHLLSKGPETLRIALAGRSLSKLEQARDTIASRVPRECTARVAQTPLLVADSSDQESLDRMAASTRVVLSTAGPFVRLGVPVVLACLRNRTHYVDSTGEGQFIRQLIQQFHEDAVRAGVRIVPSCGFDSIPSDLGALVMANNFHKLGKKTDSVRCVVTDIKGGASGGTIHSIIGIAETSSIQDLLTYQYWLNSDKPEDVKSRPDPGYPVLFRYNRDLSRYETAWFMEVTNTPYVRRTWELLSKQYGTQFKYIESMGLFSNFILALGCALGIIGMFLGLGLPPVRWLVKKLVPAGSGPSVKACENGRVESRFVAIAEDGTKAFGIFKMEKDAGYAGTAILLSESAICLALDEAVLEGNKAEDVGPFGVLEGGVLTAASAMGMVIVRRLRAQGIQLEVMESKSDK